MVAPVLSTQALTPSAGVEVVRLAQALSTVFAASLPSPTFPTATMWGSVVPVGKATPTVAEPNGAEAAVAAQRLMGRIMEAVAALSGVGVVVVVVEESAPITRHEQA